MKIAIGSDHAGFRLKGAIADHFGALGHEVMDLGTNGPAAVDYPDFAKQVALAVREGRAQLGALVCGSGIGMCIAANKYRGIRAALCHSELEARLARLHNDANVLCLGERILGVELAKSVALAFLQASFEGGRHAARVAKIAAVEQTENR